MLIRDYISNWAPLGAPPFLPPLPFGEEPVEAWEFSKKKKCCKKYKKKGKTFCKDCPKARKKDKKEKKKKDKKD